MDFIATSSYSWDDNEITISLFHVANESDTASILEASEEKCREVRHTALQALAPMYLLSRSGGDPQAKIEMAAGRALEEWFSHPGGYQSSEREDDLGQRLARITYVEVYLPGENKTVTCRGRISEWEPSYKIQQQC